MESIESINGWGAAKLKLLMKYIRNSLQNAIIWK